jgi:hypothetical protein
MLDLAGSLTIFAYSNIVSRPSSADFDLEPAGFYEHPKDLEFHEPAATSQD